MFEHMNTMAAALVVLPVIAIATAAWRRDVAPTAAAVSNRSRALVPATGVFGTAVDGYATKFGPQSRGSSW